MEIVLQWLDELDDLVFATLLTWRGVCRFGLALGLPAALVLTPLFRADLGMVAFCALTGVSAGSVLAWGAAALVTVRANHFEVLRAA